MDLISRKEALECLDKRRTYELMAGRKRSLPSLPCRWISCANYVKK